MFFFSKYLFSAFIHSFNQSDQQQQCELVGKNMFVVQYVCDLKILEFLINKIFMAALHLKLRDIRINFLITQWKIYNYNWRSLIEICSDESHASFFCITVDIIVFTQPNYFTLVTTFENSLQPVDWHGEYSAVVCDGKS